ALARARAVREAAGGAAPVAGALAELADRGERGRGVAPVDQRVAAAAEVVRHARDPARELPLGDVLREVRSEQRADDRDVEHALVIRDYDVGGGRLHAGGAPHEAPL